MKSVMISIQPKWCELIASGKKTVEVRKSKPNLHLPFKCYIYETKGKTDTPWMDEDGHEIFQGRGAVIGEFICDRISTIAYTMDGFADVVDCETSCLNPKDFIEYGKGKPLYGWHISNLKIYGEPKELNQFWKHSADGERPCEKGKDCEYEYYDYSEDCRACGIDYGGDECPYMKMSRPPQSWCYVEDLP